MSYQESFEIKRKKLYEKEKDFNNFNLTEEQLEHIQELIETFKKNKDITDKTDNFTFYRKIIEYLTTPVIHYDLPTFDERIVFLIQAIDPELRIYENYINTEIINISYIEALSPEEQRELLDLRKRQINEFQIATRNAFSFYDSKLIHYESLYYKKLQKHDKLATSVQKDYLYLLFTHSASVKSFAGISDSRYQELALKAEEYKLSVDNYKNSNVLSFNMLSLNKILRLRSVAEMFVFFVLVIDPDLTLLQIYEEESTNNSIKKRSIEEIGTYHPGLIGIEKLYHQRFCPDKKISIWSL